MKKISYSYTNTIIGIIVAVFSFVIFSLTVEPTASYWDCSEYISTSAKLQVGHPPGAPLFQMLGAIFSTFAFESDQIALSVNMMSVTSSALTILFLFWSISYLIKQQGELDEDPITINEAFKIFGSSALGCLTFTFTDSFWFNAVEAEVYAMATLILSLLFWLGLKWIDNLDSKRGDKWLILICFVIGLSFGVHFMGLLAIPAIGLLYYFKKYSFSIKSFLLANIVSISILLFIFKLLLPSTLSIFGYIEVFFVNEIGLPFNFGTIFSAISMILIIYYILNRSQRKKQYLVNTITLCVTFIFIGFSSWLMIPIRSNANTVINENAPSDARSLLAYYNLEQYPDTYLFKGPMFSDIYAGQDEDEPYRNDKPKYERDYKKNKYIIVNDWEKGKLNNNRKHVGFFPRMWSSENAVNYLKFTGFLDFSIKREFNDQEQLTQIVNQFKSNINSNDVSPDEYHQFLSSYGSYLDINKPSLISNFKYFLLFQVNKMYFRYFLWNFAGRQNDMQWRGGTENGNWLSGINFIDEYRLGPQKNLPTDLKNNKARNTYYFIPLILGLIGLIFLYKQDFKNFWPLIILFLFTGLALKFYLNERIYEPRERDYALVGSFYTFCIFIGYSFLAIFKFFEKKINNHITLIITSILCFSCPIILATNNWDDHDRSERYTAQSLAKAYLDSIDKDKQAIIYTIGDNDTFALWYAQEIENYRTDVRTINTSLLATDWYMDQMKRKAYKSNPIQSTLEHSQYAYGVRDYIKFENIIDSTRWDLKDFISWISSDNERTKYKFLLSQYGYGAEELKSIPLFTQNMVYYPTNKIRFYVNKENVLNSGIIDSIDRVKIVDYIDIDLPKSGLYKNQILMLDILSKNDWKRPIYFTGGSFKESEYMWMKDYLQLDGLVYKLVPIKTSIDENNPYQMGRIDANRMYNIVKKWEWGNSQSSQIYHDPETRKNSISFRSNLHRLSESLIEIGEVDKAEEILNLSFEKMPLDFFGYYTLSEPYIKTYYDLENYEKGYSLYKAIEKKYFEFVKYYSNSYNKKNFNVNENAENIFTYTERLRSLIENQIKSNYKFSEINNSIERFIRLTNVYKDLYGSYDYYEYLTSFLQPLYKLDKIRGRSLYLNISSQKLDRISLLKSSENDSNKTYIKNLINDEILSFKDLIENISSYEDENFLVEEINKLNELVD